MTASPTLGVASYPSARLEEHVAFPSLMGDKITLHLTPEERVEDRFCQGRPPLERVGGQLVDDVDADK